MDQACQLDAMVEVLGRLGIELRRERLGGAGGGLCQLRGKRVVFIDLDADPATRVESCLRAIAALPEADGVYIAPALREQIDRLREVQRD